MKLNLGCGKVLLSDCVNVDYKNLEGVDEIVDLEETPWKWEKDSVDSLYLLHFIEHVRNPLAVLLECHRVLKPGGTLFIKVPFYRGLYGIPQLDHHSYWGYMTFANHLLKPTYLNNYKELFDTVLYKYHYLYGMELDPIEHIQYKDGRQPGMRRTWQRMIYYVPYKILQFIINSCPLFYEKILVEFLGGADEILWIGKKK